MKKLLALLSCLIITISTGLVGCSAEKDPNTIRVGTIVGPETQLYEVAQQVAKERYGLNIQFVPFTDYQMPNAALSDGSIDANIFQHQPYLDQSIKQHDYKLLAIGKTFIYPVGIYSQKFKSLQDVPANARVAIPNDPSNQARSLVLLQEAGLITLNEKAGDSPGLQSIVGNPKHLEFAELDAAQIPRALSDVDLAVINTNYAVPAKLNPLRDSLFHEPTDSPYANVVVVREADKNDPRFQKLLAALHSDEVVKKAQQLFGDSAVPAWKQ